MAKELEGPTWFYDPVARSGQIFHKLSDVPEGWVETLSDAVPHDGMSREAIVTALNEGGVRFKKNEATGDLHGKLRAALEKALADNGASVAEGATVPELLEQVAAL